MNWPKSSGSRLTPALALSAKSQSRKTMVVIIWYAMAVSTNFVGFVGKIGNCTRTTPAAISDVTFGKKTIPIGWKTKMTVTMSLSLLPHTVIILT
mmetsp:Transcript_19502/g.42383  ORF Transcript_19502/g.42383 Transcript_19502/m.42383 type:complete len:95 (-) Transcript_19502:4427-4711(-)